MEQIVLPRGGGKTHKLLQYAREHNCVYLCSCPGVIKGNAMCLGFEDIRIEPYSYIYEAHVKNEKVVIDEIHIFLQDYFDWTIAGFSLTEPKDD